MLEISNITADLSCRERPPDIFAKQDDTSRAFRVVFVFGEDLIDLSGAAAALHILRPDGVLCSVSGTADDTSETVLFALGSQALAVSGEARAEFVLTGSGGEVLSSPPARLVIIPKLIQQSADSGGGEP